MAQQTGAQLGAAPAPQAAPRQVNTFIVRRSQPTGTATHYEIAHLQSGRRVTDADLPTATAWIGRIADAQLRSA